MKVWRTDRLTDQPTNQPTDKAGCRVAKHATKNLPLPTRQTKMYRIKCKYFMLWIKRKEMLAIKRNMFKYFNLMTITICQSWLLRNLDNITPQPQSKDRSLFQWTLNYCFNLLIHKCHRISNFQWFVLWNYWQWQWWWAQIRPNLVSLSFIWSFQSKRPMQPQT